MYIPDLILSFAGPLVLLGLALILGRRKLQREFPFFFIYVLYASGAGVLREVITHPGLIYFMFYWLSEALYSILALLVMREVFYRIFSLKNAIFGWFRWLLPLTICAILGSWIWGFYCRPYPGLFSRLAAGIYWFDMGVHFLEGTILLLVLALKIIFSVSWRRYEFGILTGFGISAYVTMTADLLVLAQGHRYETFFRYGPALAYLFATLIWLHAFWRPLDRTRRPALKVEELHGNIRLSKASLARIKRVLGLRQAPVS